VVFRRTERGARLLLLRAYKNWDFPKGMIEPGETELDAAKRETAEETGLTDLAVRQPVDSIEWHFRFRGKLIHKVCHFFLMETAQATTSPQQTEGITACRWLPFEEAYGLVSYANARDVLRRAHEMVSTSASARA